MIDSLTFLPMALTTCKLHGIFGWTEPLKSRQVFPQTTLIPLLTKVISGLSQIKRTTLYDPESINEERRAKFIRWYMYLYVKPLKLTQAFMLRDELLEYCMSDIDILCCCCKQFCTLFKKVTSSGPEDEGIDSFQHCITNASTYNLTYRCLFLSPETIVVLPTSEYLCE